MKEKPTATETPTVQPTKDGEGLATTICYAKGMMVEITELSFKGRWAKLLKQVNLITWSLQVSGREPMNFIESEFKPSDFHKSMNRRILSKHNVKLNRQP
tara:strand:+ start:53 stop:352 length:300 start_codon:yes stop_codon:yes gene_type:complete